MLSNGTRPGIPGYDNATAASDASDEIRDRLGENFPKTAELIDKAEDEVLAFACFPKTRQRKTRAVNPWSGSTRKPERRSLIMEISPNPASAIRLAGTILADTHNE